MTNRVFPIRSNLLLCQPAFVRLTAAYLALLRVLAGSLQKLMGPCLCQGLDADARIGHVSAQTRAW